MQPELQSIKSLERPQWRGVPLITHQPTLIIVSGSAAPAQTVPTQHCQRAMLIPTGGGWDTAQGFFLPPRRVSWKTSQSKALTCNCPDSSILSCSCQNHEALVRKWQLGLPDEPFGYSLPQKQLEQHAPCYISPARELKVWEKSQKALRRGCDGQSRGAGGRVENRSEVCNSYSMLYPSQKCSRKLASSWQTLTAVPKG